MKNKNFILIIIIIIGLISVFSIKQYTLAKYKEQIEGTTTISLASWDIEVNAETITGKTSLDADITPVFPGNQYVNPGVIAPGAEGYFDVIIDPSNVDVAFSYTITSGTALTSNVTDLIVTGYAINPGIDPVIIPYTTNVYGEILIGDTPTTVRLYIQWDDDNGAMNNQTDTEVIINPESVALMHTVITFNQLRN